MTTLLQSMAVDTFVSNLRMLSQLLDKGAAFAQATNLDADALLDARLAPDMFSLTRQVKLACEHAHNGVAYLIGREPMPRIREEDRTIEALKGRIEATTTHLLAVPAASFEGAEERRIEILLQGDTLVLAMTGGEFLRGWAFPNFYFHVVTAYGILRHLGLDVGKRDFMSPIRGLIRPRAAM